jgi:hypothetical protein
LGVALNFTGEVQSVEAMAGLGTGHVVISTELDREGPVAFKELKLRPHEGVIVTFD